MRPSYVMPLKDHICQYVIDRNPMNQRDLCEPVEKIYVLCLELVLINVTYFKIVINILLKTWIIGCRAVIAVADNCMNFLLTNNLLTAAEATANGTLAIKFTIYISRHPTEPARENSIRSSVRRCKINDGAFEWGRGLLITKENPKLYIKSQVRYSKTFSLFFKSMDVFRQRSGAENLASFSFCFFSTRYKPQESRITLW